MTKELITTDENGREIYAYVKKPTTEQCDKFVETYFSDCEPEERQELGKEFNNCKND